MEINFYFIVKKGARFLFIFLIEFISWPAFSQTQISGNQSGIISKVNSPYILIGTITIPQGQTLTIEPGVTIISQSYTNVINVNGTLIAKGTASDSIRFVGLPSSSTTYGGYIVFENVSRNSILEYVSIDHWGNYSSFNQGVLFLYSSSIVVTKCSIRNSKGRAINVANNIDSAYAVYGNRFFNNINDIECYAANIDGMYNNENARIVIWESHVKRNIIWRHPGSNSHYALNPDATIWIDQNQTLTIEPGVELRSEHYSDQIAVSGTLVARGTVTDSIRFVGFPTPNSTASSHGGDIVFMSTSRNSVLEYVVIDRWGDKNWNNRALALFSSSISFTKCSLRNSEDRGLYYDASGTTTISNCSFSRNVTGVYIWTGCKSSAKSGLKEL